MNYLFLEEIFQVIRHKNLNLNHKKLFHFKIILLKVNNNFYLRIGLIIKTSYILHDAIEVHIFIRFYKMIYLK